jgi:hypothetical protein
VGSPLSTQASGDVMMTCDLSMDTPHSTLAGGAVRMRRMTFLFNSEAFIVLIPPPTGNSKVSWGKPLEALFLLLLTRIIEMPARVQSDFTYYYHKIYLLNSFGIVGSRLCNAGLA